MMMGADPVSSSARRDVGDDPVRSSRRALSLTQVALVCLYRYPPALGLQPSHRRGRRSANMAKVAVVGWRFAPAPDGGTLLQVAQGTHSCTGGRATAVARSG